MKLNKKSINILLGLCLLSMISVGFSSWLVNETGMIDNPNADGSVETENVVSLGDLVYLDTTQGDNNSGVKTFKYKVNGYLNDLGNVSDRTKFACYFTIDLQKTYDEFSSYSGLELDLSLGYVDGVSTSFNFFKADGSNTRITPSVVCSYTKTVSPSVVNETLPSLDTVVTFPDILEQYHNGSIARYAYFSVEYELFAVTGDYFKDNVFAHLEHDAIELNLGILMTGKV